MAMKHRKLFPTSTNQTDCPEFCDPTCPYGCYPYPYPDFYFFQAPPPPPLPPPPTDQGQNLSSHVIIIVSVLTTVFLLLSYYLIIVKYCFRRARLESDGQDLDYVDENQGPAIDHHIWFINTIGLQPSLINKITVFKFRKSDVLTEGTDCSVCLSEFQEDETLRLLPKCNHAFHIPCIDTWLRSHTNCPLCRAGILSNTWSVSNPSASDEQNSINLRPEEQTQIENSERNGELRENRSETEGGISLTQVDGEGKEIDDSKDQNSLNLTPDVETQMENSESNGELGEKMAETDDVIGLLHANDKRKELEDSKDGGTSNGWCGVFPVVELEVRRSASMEFSSAVTVNLADCTEDSPQSNMGIVPMQDLENPKMNEVIGRDTSSQSLNNGSVSLKRSFSYGGRMFLPRHSRNLSSILPL